MHVKATVADNSDLRSEESTVGVQVHFFFMLKTN